jgi:hypothetical protein
VTQTFRHLRRLQQLHIKRKNLFYEASNSVLEFRKKLISIPFRPMPPDASKASRTQLLELFHSKMAVVSRKSPLSLANRSSSIWKSGSGVGGRSTTIGLRERGASKVSKVPDVRTGV